MLEVAASEVDTVETQSTKNFNRISDTMMTGEDDTIIYEFDSSEEMINYIENTDIIVGPSTTPWNMNDPWKTLNFTWLSHPEVQALAVDIRSAQRTGGYIALASAWMYKLGALGATVASIGYLMSNYGNQIIIAADNNQSATIYHQQNTQWNGYGPRTRYKIVRFN